MKVASRFFAGLLVVLLLAGVAAHFFGAVPAVVAGGILTLGIVGAVSFLVPSLRRFDLDQASLDPVRTVAAA